MAFSAVARSARTGVVAPASRRPALPLRPAVAPKRRTVVSKAAASGDDFDALLNSIAEKFEKTENKPVVIGYVAAGVSAFVFAEWLIHLPALDILLGFPIQVLGVIMAPVLAVRYLLNGKDVTADINDTITDISKKLPGLEKK
mmetsp:Transcript_9978/g.21308  ORF Transcript_9978/g.21308 Transcript_9978/m.21308 type:complete len:143 (-) Transcript_9978:1119-1547(-)|eukprot:CAMPEP_0202896384 /NCGR_PEP_ID=MMETSP1392-20130828/5397_1 /ASSEMBLY_ACC=CAM_ASM_000868 /TAXON_ID=225041 /ORGANISM="Chlamydomonas chlamydogama, Strain SAG 11-48b" /LENGTH=142 /DNA_ID=CAMNT_0049581731 /DNA_START=83 /DNA_END=511 /DNA_ORIENTATION=-